MSSKAMTSCLGSLKVDLDTQQEERGKGTPSQEGASRAKAQGMKN